MRMLFDPCVALRLLNRVMKDNARITDENQELVVETLRHITEIVIWGDQNDPIIFEFFLEKEMVRYFNSILLQGPPVHVSVQVLQTINMLFDNLSKQTSICRARVVTHLLSNTLYE